MYARMFSRDMRNMVVFAMNPDKAGYTQPDADSLLMAVKAGLEAETVPYVDEMAEALSAAMDYDKMYRDAMKSMGMSKSDIDYIMSEMGDMDVYGALGDAMQQMVKIVGDLELDVYLSNGYVSAVM